MTLGGKTITLVLLASTLAGVLIGIAIAGTLPNEAEYTLRELRSLRTALESVRDDSFIMRREMEAVLADAIAPQCSWYDETMKTLK